MQARQADSGRMRVVPPRNGWLWLKEGARLFGRSPFTWVFAVFSYWVITLGMKGLPHAAGFVLSLLMPAFAVSFMALARECASGRRASPLALVAGLHLRLPTLLALGGIYIAASVAILAVTALFDGGSVMRWMLLGEAAHEDVPAGRMFLGGLLATLLSTPMVAAFWFAPVLAAWDRMSATKALFFSFFAVWRNWRAFLFYAGAVLAASLPLFLLFGVAVTLLANLGGSSVAGSPEARVGAGMLLASPLLFGAVAILLASFYASYRDIFPADSPVAAHVLEAG
jgi:hypothetical protein